MPAAYSSLEIGWDIGCAPWLGPEAIAARARARWRALVADARRRSPFYRDLYRDLPPDEQLEPASLPPVAKATLMAALPSAVTVRGLDRSALDAFIADPAGVGQPFDGCAIWTSSGTSGVPGIFLHDEDAIAVYDALQFFRCRGLGASVERGAQLWFPGRYALVAATGGHFAGVATIERLRRTVPWMAPWLSTFSLMQPLGDLAAQLDAWQPAILATYPSAAEMLADEQAAGRLRLRLRELWTGGECLSAATRVRLEQVFGCAVHEEYGASEFLSIGAGCPHGWLHVNADWVLLEPVDAQMRPVAPGEASHSVLLTNLVNRALPLIRYDLGDSVTTLAGRCACGNPLPAIRVEGRRDDVLRLCRGDDSEVRLLPLVLETVLEDEAGVFDFQLEQAGRRQLRLRLGAVEHPRAAVAREALKRYLDSVGLAATEIELAGEPPRRTAVGAKLRRIVCAAGARP